MSFAHMIWISSSKVKSTNKIQGTTSWKYLLRLLYERSNIAASFVEHKEILKETAASDVEFE